MLQRMEFCLSSTFHGKHLDFLFAHRQIELVLIIATLLWLWCQVSETVKHVDMFSLHCVVLLNYSEL